MTTPREDSRPPGSLILLCALVATLNLLACLSGSGDGSVVAPGTDVVLISIDTLRADHLGCYGYARPTSPHIDALASRSFVFERAYAQSHNTLVSHATLLTSLNPISHGATPRRPIDARITTLAEVLKDGAYRRGAFTTHLWLSRKMGFAQGFGRFVSTSASAEEINAKVFDWLRTIRALRAKGEERPFFLFVHYYDVHSDFRELPYETGTEYDERFTGDYDGAFRGCRDNSCSSRLLGRVARDPDLLSAAEFEWVKGLYDGGIAYTDTQVGALLQELRELAFFDGSWIVVTSDHGEEFLEHGGMLHSQPYEETARVPLIVRPPGGIDQDRLGDPVGLVDLASTLLECVGLEAPAGLEGHSLVPLMESGRGTSPPVFWTGLERPPYPPSTRIAVRHGSNTLVSREAFTRVELYEHDTDPHQQRDVAAERSSTSRELRDVALSFYEEQIERARARDDRTISASQEDIEKLRALGYLVN